MRHRRNLSAAVGVAAVFGLANLAWAQAGTTLTPDRQSFMVNKDIGDERWTITLTLAQVEPPLIASITGNVFRSDGGPPAFVVCQERPDSTGSLSVLSSVFRLDCKGTDACPDNARECARTSWRPLAEDLQIPAEFFLPPDGRGGATSAAARRDEVATTRAPVAAPSQSTPRGATLTFDGLNFLVNKDVGTERWSISVNLIPTLTSAGGAVDRLLSITGNVFQADGSPPAFVYCLPTGSSTGTLDDPASQFQLACQGTSPCDTTANECAANDWADLGQVDLAASFFLPPEGLPAAVQSDPEIVVIGRTSDPPAIGVRDFSGAASASESRPLGLSCAEGSSCTVARIGSCEDVSGEQVLLDDGACACVVDEVPAECITCGAGASGSCGGNCEFDVNGATARGSCLPFVATSSGCVCYANSAEGGSDLESCAGVLDVSCPGERCCADDPRDGCSRAAGDYACAGICVDDDCVEEEGCGICDLGDPGVCGDGVVSGAEACDGSDLRGESCVSLGFVGGELSCTDDCTFDEDGCVACSGEGESCTTSDQCCTGACIDDRCAAGPTPSPAPTATPTPAATPGATATPAPTGELPCQPLPGQPCLESGFGECCGSNLACVFGPGTPPRRICSTIAECGNGEIEPGEECETIEDCGESEICDGCQCVVPPAQCGNDILEPGEECESASDCGTLGPSMICDDCECVGGIPASR